MVNMSRGSLAKKTGVNPETIRYYESIRLMPDPPRTTRGHRIYRELHQKRLAFIHRCRELGFTIDELRELLSLVDGGNYSCAEVLQSTQAHIDRISSKISDLNKIKRTLSSISNKCSGENVPDCPIIEALWKAP